MSKECKVPPAGWRCTRNAGHDGPCAAVPKKPGWFSRVLGGFYALLFSAKSR